MTQAPATTAGPPGARIPGAQQLELLRRLNLAGRPAPELAERVLAAGTTGRGRPDLDLTGAAGRDGRFGAAAVDPTTLPADELLRVAVGLLAEDLAATRPPLPRAVPPWLRPLGRRYRVVGDPRLADALREELLRRGRRIGGRDARVLVLGTSTGQMLADAWVSRFGDTGAPTWTAWLEEWADRDAVPTRVDLAAAARHWADLQGACGVHVVLDAGDLPALVRARRLPPPPAPVPAHAAELARRVAAVLGVLVEARSRRLLVARTLLPWLSDVARQLDRAAPPPGVPRRLAPWAARTAARVHAGVLAGDYPVHGRPDRLLDDHDGVLPSAGGALDVAVAALLRPAGGGRRTGGTRRDQA